MSPILFLELLELKPCSVNWTLFGTHHVRIGLDFPACSERRCDNESELWNVESSFAELFQSSKINAQRPPAARRYGPRASLCSRAPGSLLGRPRPKLLAQKPVAFEKSPRFSDGDKERHARRRLPSLQVHDADALHGSTIV
jgi:hypothetical protein